MGESRFSNISGCFIIENKKEDKNLPCRFRYLFLRTLYLPLLFDVVFLKLS